MAGLIYFFSAKAFLILAIVTIKIVYLGFLISYTSKVTPIIWMSKVLNKLWSSVVSYIVFILFYLNSSSALNMELVLISDLGLSFLSIFFIIGYQSF